MADEVTDFSNTDELAKVFILMKTFLESTMLITLNQTLLLTAVCYISHYPMLAFSAKDGTKNTCGVVSKIVFLNKFHQKIQKHFSRTVLDML